LATGTRGACWVLPGHAGYYQGMLGTTRACWVLPGHAGYYQGMLGTIRACWVMVENCVIAKRVNCGKWT